MMLVQFHPRALAEWSRRASRPALASRRWLLHLFGRHLPLLWRAASSGSDRSTTEMSRPRRVCEIGIPFAPLGSGSVGELNHPWPCRRSLLLSAQIHEAFVNPGWLAEPFPFQSLIASKRHLRSPAVPWTAQSPGRPWPATRWTVLAARQHLVELVQPLFGLAQPFSAE